MGSPDPSHVDLLTFAFDLAPFEDDNRPIYIDAESSNRYLSRATTRTLVRKVIGGWKAAGLSQGDRVLILLDNNLFYSILYFSVIGAGGVYLGIDPTSQVLEITHILELCRPKFIIASQELLPKVLEASKYISLVTEHVFVLDIHNLPIWTTDKHSDIFNTDSASTIIRHPNQLSDFVWLVHHSEMDWVRIYDEATARTTPAAMFSTCGASGLSNVAILSHFSLITQHLSMESYPLYGVSRLISLPLFDVFAALFAHIFPVRVGQPVYILPRFDLDQYVNVVKQFKITDTVVAPLSVHALNQSSLQISDFLDSIRWVGVGGAPITADALQRFQKRLRGSAMLSQIWDVTGVDIEMLVQHPQQNYDGSIGRPLPGYDTKSMDSFVGTVMMDHEPRELCARYDGMLTGYVHQPPHVTCDQSATGNITAKVDGKYCVSGRARELINVNGWQVDPAELEDILLSHSCIQDAGVIGVLRDDGITELPRAYIVRSADSNGRCSTLSAKEIYDFARSKLASYKSLDGGIFFVDWIPRTASGKIQRVKLAQMDQYRRSVTELLMLHTNQDVDRKSEKVNFLQARAEQRRTGTRANSRSASTQHSKSDLPSAGESRGVPPGLNVRGRSRTSLVDKMKALEASRILVSPKKALA